MANPESFAQESFLKEDPFGLIPPEDYESLGIAPSDILPGTFPARKHPSRLMSRFGGNAYGFGFFEVYDRLSPKDLRLLQSITPENPDHAGKFYRDINRIYRDIGLLIRFSRFGKPYYLIPFSLVLTSLSTVKSKADEISKIIDFHRKKYLQESHRIGLLTYGEDLVINELSLRFREHQFVLLDSFEKLSRPGEPFDLIILARDIYEIVFMERFSPRTGRVISKKDLEKYAHYIVGKVYDLLKRDGEIFVIANRVALKSEREINVDFRTEEEGKNFLLYTHIFKTERRYQTEGNSVEVPAFEFQKYLNPPYVEKEVLDKLLGQRRVEDMTMDEIRGLPYLNFSLDDGRAYDQEKTWSKLLSVYFNRIFLKPLIPDSVKEGWFKRFSADEYMPDYMLIYLGQKKPPQTTFEELQAEVSNSKLAGCPVPLVADYRNSFDYVGATLQVVKEIRNAGQEGVPELFMERLREPFENKRRRYGGFNDVLKLVKKMRRLEKIKNALNPDGIEGPKTSMLDKLATLSLFGFFPGELKEIYLIVVGHTPMARILSGKMNEKALKPISDLARNCEPHEALNLLRYCRLMSMAEAMASKRSDLKQEEVTELFDLYESMVKIVTNRDMDWDRLRDEKISAMGGIRHVAVRKILKMMNQFQFLPGWQELKSKGQMEKEVLADYDEDKLKKVERVIKLVKVMDQYDEMYFKGDLLKASSFYRKLLNTEFHGTGRIFERLDSELVFLLLWITVNVVRGEVINFNPILSGVAFEGVAAHLDRLDEEVQAVNPHYLNFAALSRFSEQLYEDETSFVVGTGFQLKVNHDTQAIDVTHIDMNQNVEALESLCRRIAGMRIAQIPPEELAQLERLFGNVEGFYQSHLKLMAHEELDLRLPERERTWFRRAESLRSSLIDQFLPIIFEPEDLYQDLDVLYRHAPSLLEFVVPEFTAFQSLKPPETVHIKSSLMDQVFASTRKLQALLRRNRADFQDKGLLHQMAQREFGPMTAGIIGLSEAQVDSLEGLAAALKRKPALMDALIKSFVFRDIGLLPSLVGRYGNEIHPADHAEASAWLLQNTEIGARYAGDPETRRYLAALVRHHNLLNHMIRGEFSFEAIEDVVAFQDKDLFDAIFLSSFILFYSIGEDLMMEDLADSLFKFRNLCLRILAGEIRPEDHMRELYLRKGHIFFALEAFQQDGPPGGTSLSAYFETFPLIDARVEQYISAGKTIYALERIFRLRGIRHAQFRDLANMMVKIPLRYIYRKRKFVGVGYATFEKELFEALRIYNSLNLLPEEVKEFICRHLVADQMRIFGFETVSGYLTYENMIKLLLLTMMASGQFSEDERPVCINFFHLAARMDKRYEAVNDALSHLTVEQIWKDRSRLQEFFKGKSGIVLCRDEAHRVLSVDFKDRINMGQKMVHMESISDLEQLKNYFHYSLRTLRKTPYYTEDYEQELEQAFERRMREITDHMVEEAKSQMEMKKNFREVHQLYQDLMERALDIGFDDDQKHRLNDLYEMRKDHLKRKKVEEVGRILRGIHDVQELRDYWDSVKEFLLANRPFFGKEFENLVARKFDEVMGALEESEYRKKEIEQAEEPWKKKDWSDGVSE
jgi:hypothetical protein